MVNTNDLRIGVFLNFDCVRSQVTEIKVDADSVLPHIVADENHAFSEVKSMHVKGIRITNELLTEFGFVKARKMSETMDKWTIALTNFMIYFNGKEAGLITSLPSTQPCLYLHELQNLYHSITGGELSLKLGG